MQDVLASTLNEIMNAKKAGKRICIIRNFSNLLLKVLEIMRKNKYIEEYAVEKGKFNRLIIKFGEINECKAIKPRFTVTREEAEKYIRRFLPARDFGILIFSTDRGLMTQKEITEKGMGGCLIAYCY